MTREDYNNKERVLTYVQDEYDGYTDIKYLGDWEGYEAYLALVDENTDGNGAYVLLDDRGVRFADHDEADEIEYFFDLKEATNK